MKEAAHIQTRKSAAASGSGSTIARLSKVSKMYHLGLTRSSLPQLARTAVRGLLRRGAGPEGPVHWALRDIDLELKRGQNLALVGSNGAGKTTILKLLSNITKPTSGTVEVNGRLSALIELGAGFHPDLTGRENVYLNGTILGLKRQDIRAKFDEIVDFSGLERFIDTPVKRYSSGMAVRLGFAVASCLDPEILLVDEVLAVGDAMFRQKCLERIKQLSKDGASLIFVTHNLYMVKAVCDSALYLSSGQVLLEGAPDEIITAYERDVHEQEAAVRMRQRGASEAADDEIDVRGVRVTGQRTGDGSDDLASAGPARIEVDYFAPRDIGPVQMSIFLKRADGLTVWMLRTKTIGIDIDVIQGPGRIVIELERLQLIGGSYWVEAYFLDEADCISLTPQGGQSPSFSVRGRDVSTTDDAGIFEPVATWSIEESEDIGGGPTDAGLVTVNGKGTQWSR